MENSTTSQIEILKNALFCVVPTLASYMSFLSLQSEVI